MSDTMTWPLEELDMQTFDMERWLPFQFLTSLLLVRRGWFANQALTAVGRRGCNRRARIQGRNLMTDSAFK